MTSEIKTNNKATRVYIPNQEHATGCSRCIMTKDNDPDLALDEQGVCNHCRNFELAYSHLPKGEKARVYLDNLIEEIKEYGKGKKYDCIVGVSGGIDSTYLAYFAKQRGLRTLLVHCDNGWNTELSNKNIENLCTYTGFELQTVILYWEEFKDIQLSFFKAGVVDIEMPYDYALNTVAFKIARKYDVKYILNGHNLVTEGSFLPQSWRHNKMDFTHIKGIQKRFGTRSLKNFPHFSLIGQQLILKKIKCICLLNYIVYNKQEIKKLLKEELNWRDYEGKHYENTFTRFYQGYILKRKFNIDKRQFHLSVLVQSGQITRKEAIKEYELHDYHFNQMKEDKAYILKKLGLTEESFTAYIEKAPIRNHNEYPTDQKYWDMYFKTIKVLKGVKIALRNVSANIFS